MYRDDDFYKLLFYLHVFDYNVDIILVSLGIRFHMYANNSLNGFGSLTEN